MVQNWYFRVKRKGDDIADPISGEFFADGSLESLGTALIREAVQNALDAGRSVERGGRPIRVSLGLYRGSHAASVAHASEWFGDLQPHIHATGNGLKEAPRISERCDYLVVEDFGTSGLTGDTDSDRIDGAQNNFVDFLRSDGRTRKAGGDRGSWGVGKNVFPRSSRINGFLAYTVRNTDGRQLLTGKCILKIRRIGDASFQPPCYLATSWKDDDVPRPHEDPLLIERFRTAFRITRRQEPGLSLVVPWVDPEITFADLFESAVSQYCVAIVAGSLEITLTDGSESVTLSAANILETVARRAPGHRALVELVHWALARGTEHRVVLNAPPPDAPQQWSHSLVSQDALEVISRELLQEGRTSVRVPVHVRRKGSREATPTFFDVFMERDDSPRHSRPAFFREQLSISGVKRAVGVSKLRSLVLIDDQPLADLLRSAEPPNHTDWDPKTANFKQEYRDGNHVITFVKSAVKSLVGILRADHDQPDTSIAIDFFSIESESDSEPRTKSSGRRAGSQTPPATPVPQPRKLRFRIRPVEGGFSIGPGDPDTVPPRRLRVHVAYDVLSGSPWRQYEKVDFDFTADDRSGIHFAPEGDSEVRVTGPNRLELKITSPNFHFSARGFDQNRDLIVRAHDPKEPVNADPATQLH